MKRYIFPDPLDATCKLQPDSLAVPIVGVPDTHPANGRLRSASGMRTRIRCRHQSLTR